MWSSIFVFVKLFWNVFIFLLKNLQLIVRYHNFYFDSQSVKFKVSVPFNSVLDYLGWLFFCLIITLSQVFTFLLVRCKKRNNVKSVDYLFASGLNFNWKLYKDCHVFNNAIHSLGFARNLLKKISCNFRSLMWNSDLFLSDYSCCPLTQRASLKSGYHKIYESLRRGVNHVGKQTCETPS